MVTQRPSLGDGGLTGPDPVDLYGEVAALLPLTCERIIETMSTSSKHMAFKQRCIFMGLQKLREGTYLLIKHIPLTCCQGFSTLSS